MKRELNLEEISDGKRYRAQDLVKADCHGCVDCHLCCTGMGDSIVLDPYDGHLLCQKLQQPLLALVGTQLELHVVDGLTLPSLSMAGEAEACTFLDETGRCSIHDSRPGICRLFPLGRIYEDGGFSYFLQVRECPYENKSKVRVQKWLDMPELPRYERFVLQWHTFLQDVGAVLQRADAETAKQVNLYVLQLFYGKSYSAAADFYVQFEARLAQARDILESV